MKLSTVFKKVREEFSKDYYSFVCTCIDNTPGISIPDQDRAREFVEELLDGSITLEGWLARHEYYQQERVGMSHEHWKQKIRATRLAWMDWMIEYWESKGE